MRNDRLADGHTAAMVPCSRWIASEQGQEGCKQHRIPIFSWASTLAAAAQPHAARGLRRQGMTPARQLSVFPIMAQSADFALAERVRLTKREGPAFVKSESPIHGLRERRQATPGVDPSLTP